MRTKLMVLFSVMVILTGCGLQNDKKVADTKYLLGIGNYKNLEFAVKSFSDGVDECLLDVRDRGHGQPRQPLALVAGYNLFGE